MSTFVDSYSVPLLLPSPILCRPFPIFFSLPVPLIDWIQPPAASPAASKQHAAPPRHPPLRLLMFFQGGPPSCLILSDGAWLLGRKHGGDNCYIGLGEALLQACNCPLQLVWLLLLPMPGQEGSRQLIRTGEERKKKQG